MQIQSLNIECFGRKTNLYLDGISDRLNVVYGPNGSGKSTTIQFVRWMLYGNSDETTRRYLGGYNGPLDAYGNVSFPVSGSITFLAEGHRRSLARQDDGSRYGRVALDGDHRYARQSNHLVSLLGNIRQHDFDVLFAPDLDQEHGLTALLQSSLTQGIDLASQQLPSERVQELRMRVDNYRRDMDQLPWSSGEWNSLLDRKKTIERRIDIVTDEHRRRRLDYDREYEDLNRRIQDGELEAERLRATWHARDEEVLTRRRELEEAYRSAEDVKREYLARRSNELSDHENHLSRARSMQSELQRRYDDLESQLRAEEVNLDRSPVDIENSVCLVQSIARQLDDMAQIFESDTNHQASYRSAFRHRRSETPSSTSIDMLRREVGRLCDTLQNERSGDRVKAIADELDQLRHTDSAMQRWITGLATRRDQLAGEIEDAERHGVSLIVESPYELSQEHPPELEVLEPLRTGRLKGVRHACDGYQPIHPEQDAFLIQLTRQRDVAQSELQSAERQLTQLMERRRDLEDALQRLTDRELDADRRELAEVDSLIRSAEERERLHREIDQTEAEIARLRENVRNSPVTEHAARILRRLTQGRFTNLRIDNTRNVSVEESTGTMIPAERLSRGIREQVYLSFCLAIITAHRRRGIQLPFILNDAFTNLDARCEDTLAAVLCEFAEMGQQVFVFTRQQHVSKLLCQVGATFLELGTPNSPPPLPLTESIDQIRFRPRGEISDDPPRTIRTQFVQPTRQRPISPPTEYRAQRRAGRPERADENPTGDEQDRYVDDREIDGRPFEQVAQPIRHPTNTRPPADFENVTFDNRPPLASTHLQTAPRRTTHDSLLPRETPIELSETVDPDMASRLRAIGIVTVSDFVGAPTPTIDEHLRSWGIESRPIRRWQDQLSLRCHIPGMGADDARLIVACGMDSVSALAETNEDALNDRLQHLLSTQRTRSGVRYSSLLADYGRGRLCRWILAARAVLSQRASNRSELRPPYESEYDPNFVYRDNTTRRTPRGQENRPEARRSQTSPDAISPRASRSKTRGQRSTKQSDKSRTQGSATLKFHLDRNDPVVDAPTIGPKTAERLRKVGVHSVDDLLAADATKLASNIDYHRITAEDIREWQCQSVLACCVPQLRGHDAQVLVACGIKDPEALASVGPEELWNIIEPFVDTPECKRIIRNGKQPDFEEIQDWISWAQDARSLQGA